MKKQLYLFYGEENFLADERINAFKEKVDNPSFNLEILDGKALSLEKLAAALCSQTLLGGSRLVIINKFKVLAEEQESYLTLLKEISPDVTVIFNCDNIDKRSKLYKFISSQGEAVEFKTFAPWEQQELISWVEKKGRFKKGAARLLTEICGNNLRVLNSEICKLTTYVGEGKEIGEADIMRLATPGEVNAFALLDALREKNIKRVLAVWQSLLRNKEDIFALTGLLITQYRLMVQMKSLPKNETDHNRMARIIGGSPYFIKKCQDNISRFSLPELKQKFLSLLTANMRLKTGEQPVVTFELLLLSLCQN
ncbi:MAG: DNA polymerase III subunit delta [bacterium]